MEKNEELNAIKEELSAVREELSVMREILDVQSCTTKNTNQAVSGISLFLIAFAYFSICCPTLIHKIVFGTAVVAIIIAIWGSFSIKTKFGSKKKDGSK